MANQTFKKSLLALAVGGICSSAAMAEDYTTGNLHAKIQDTAGNPVANAEVTVRSNKGVRRTVTTDSEGNVRIPQLPIGTYSVTVDGQGYEQLVSDNVQIQIGSAGAYTFTMQSGDSAIEEIYVTGVRQGSWDFNTTTTGLTVDVGEVFSRAPLGRDATSVVLLAPGTSAGESGFATGQYGATGTMASFAGSSIGENVYYINGMNITNFRNFIGGSTIPFELFDQIEVKTGGYQAEFGRSTGGVTNAVTKSGSNEFEFGFNAYFEPDSLTEDRKATYSSANQHDERSRTDFNLWASGAVVQDKLFFFALYNPRDIRSFDCFSGTCEENISDDPFYAVKIDWVPFDGHRFEYTYFSDDQTRDVKKWRWSDAGNARIGDASALAAAPLSELKVNRISDSVYVNGGTNQIFRYTAALTDWMTISAMYGRNEYARENYSGSNAPFLQDYRTGTPVYGVAGSNGSARNIGTWSVGQFETGEDIRDNYRIDADFYFEALGDHHVRVGWDKEDLESNVANIYSGDCWCRLYYSGSSSTGQRWRERHYYNDGGYTTENGATYIQDSWQITDDLTLMIGFRDETFENFNVEGDSYIKSDNQLAPRLGFSWDPTGDGKNRIYGSWGEYYLPIATNTNIRLAGKEVYTQIYKETVDADQDGQPDYDSNGFPLFGPDIGTLGYFSDGTLPFAEAAHAEQLDPLYQSEYILGFEHTFNDEWTVGIRYVKRDLSSLIEDVAIDFAVIQWANDNGYGADPALDPYTGFHQYALVNPGSDFRIAAVEDFGGDGVIDWIDITTDMLPYPKGERTYEAIDVTVEREWDEKWYLSLGYTWSESIGNYEGVVKSENNQDDAGLTQDFDQPGLTDGAYGPTPNDREHRFKARASYAISDQFMLAANLQVEAPRKMGCIGDHPTDYFAWAYGAASWYCGGQLTPRGSVMETDWRKTVDASFIWTPNFSMPGDGELVLRLDVFNLLDAGGVSDRWEFGDIANTSDLALGGSTLPEADPDFGKPVNYQTPRSVRFGLSYNF
jgi:hypothetical protein